MNNDLGKKAYNWVKSVKSAQIEGEYYCETRDNFQARLDRMINDFLTDSKILENDVYILSAIAGEIGNNSFDHNLGSWSDMPGVFFGYEAENGKVIIVLADRGQGVLKTLKRVKPELENDKEALFSAFNEKISGRAPESRGNGLKFVKENIKAIKAHLIFMSGSAMAELNEAFKISQSERINGCLAVIEFTVA